MNQQSSDAVNSNEVPVFGKIKDELYLISFVILCSGLVYTDSYYQRFGFRYQFLTLSVMHIIYKGITMVFDSTSMLLPYLATIFLLVIEGIAIREGWKKFLALRTPIIYLFLIVILSFIFKFAQDAGIRQAQTDLNIETSKLPKIRSLKSSGFNLEVTSQINLLFMVDNDFVVFFVPLDSGVVNAYPVIKRVQKSDVILLETNL